MNGQPNMGPKPRDFSVSSEEEEDEGVCKPGEQPSMMYIADDEDNAARDEADEAYDYAVAIRKPEMQRTLGKKIKPHPQLS